MISGRLQSDEHGVGVNLDVGFHRESFPEQIKKISIHRGGGGLANFVVLANSKLTGFTAVSYFFTLTRDEPFFMPGRWPLCLARQSAPERVKCLEYFTEQLGVCDDQLLCFLR